VNRIVDISTAPLELWGGIECTVNRVGDEWFDQVVRSGHQARPDDLDRVAALGLRTLRYPVLWERVAPVSLDSPDFAWTDQRLARLRSLGVRPIVGLVHHGSGPRYTSLLDPQFPALLATYARMVAERYPWVTDYTPVNEPLTTARFSGLYGFWYPHQRSARAFIRAFLTQMQGVVLAMEAIRAVNPGARLIQTEDCGVTTGTTATSEQVEHEAHRRWLTWDLLAGRVGREHPLHGFLRAAGASETELAFFRERRCVPDVIGLNYYLTSDRFLDDRIEQYPVELHGGNGRIRYADVEAVRANVHGIAGHQAHLTAAWQRYHLPVAITEVHLSCTRDEQMRWLVESWRGAVQAREAGADVRAVTAWALLGSFDWDTLVTQAQGHYEPGAFDGRGRKLRATRLASVIADLAAGRTPDHPVLSGTPWWHRPRRMLYGQHALRCSPGPGTPPILIAGGTGTLGRAFHRICEARALSACLFNRNDLDITNATRVDTVLRTVRPWAVINAAGYVRVDDAEREPDSCWQSNVEGAVTLAAACRRRGIPLLTFSSDLVFDGTAARPYTEHDTPCALNVYGHSKAEAETRVLGVLPDALVIRTSAFFGPWDEHNFAVHVLNALARGEGFEAPADSVVSPTYVPDLVNASLDLLIDGECGLWHLANADAMTWFEFAQAVATAFGLPAHRIRAVPTDRVWGPARRPVNSALTSDRGCLLRPVAEALASFAADVARERPAAGVRGLAESTAV
jgi:dTDP-4-dehydrorhamnose reductase